MRVAQIAFCREGAGGGEGALGYGGGIISGKLERGAASFITDGWGEGIACWLSNGSTNEETFVHVGRHS